MADIRKRPCCKPGGVDIWKLLKRCSKRLSDDLPDGWRRNLGKVVESPAMAMFVCFLLLVDLFCTILEDVLENSDLLNPKYHEEGEEALHIAAALGWFVIIVFAVEQSCCLAAFGPRVFCHVWHFIDFVVVFVSLITRIVAELVPELRILAGLVALLRAWKFFACVFDVMLLQHEVARLEEDKKKPEAMSSA